MAEGLNTHPEEEVTMDQIHGAVMSALEQAGAHVKEAFEAANHVDIHKGEGGDFTTETDIQADEILVESLREKLPGFDFLTEETAPEDGDYSEYKELENLIVIDPIDGTANFRTGRLNFGISVGVVDKGIPKYGAVMLPAYDTTFSARADREGIEINGRPETSLTVTDTEALEDATVLIDMPHDPNLKPLVSDWIGKLSNKTRRIGMDGSAVGDLTKLFASDVLPNVGRTDAFIHPGLKPWDTAAAALLVEKAGGVVTTADGDRWDIFETSIIASNEALSATIIDLLQHSPRGGKQPELVRRWLEEHRGEETNLKAARIAGLAHETLRNCGEKVKLDSQMFWESIGWKTVGTKSQPITLTLVTPFHKKERKRKRIGPTREVWLIANGDVDRPCARIYPPNHKQDIAVVHLGGSRNVVGGIGEGFDPDDFNNEAYLDEILGYVKAIKKHSEWAQIYSNLFRPAY